MSNTTQFDFTLVQELGELSAHHHAWNELVSGRPMRSVEWMCAWWRQFKTKNKHLHIGLLHQHGQLVGIAPLYRVDLGATRQVLRLLGDTGDICTDHTTWFAKPGLEQVVGQNIAHQLLQSPSWSRFQAEMIDASEPAMAASLSALRAAGCAIHTQQKDSCWSIAIPPTWEDYLAMLTKNHRKRCRRWVRRFFDNDAVQLHTADEKTHSAAWDVFLNLHQQRWATAQRPQGSFTNLPFSRFHEEISQHLASRGQLRLCYLTLNDEPIASEYQFVDHDTLYAYQSGMSMAHDDVGPGNLSVVAMIRHCIDRGLNRLDFMRGDESYKAHWQAQPSARCDLRVWRPGFTGQLAYGYQTAKQLAANWIRK